MTLLADTVMTAGEILASEKKRKKNNLWQSALRTMKIFQEVRNLFLKKDLNQKSRYALSQTEVSRRLH